MVLLDINTIDDLKPFIKSLGADNKSEFLHHAIVANLDFDFINWLIKIGADVNFKFRDETPLMASFRNINVMKLLLRNGANIEAQTKDKETALFYAIKFNNLSAVKILIDNGANINAITTPSAIASHKPPFSKTPLTYAKRYADKEIIDLLIKHGAEDNLSDSKSIKEWINLGDLDL